MSSSKRRKAQQPLADVVPVGSTIERFTQQVGIPRRNFFLLPESCKPFSVRIGRRVIITEPAAAWLNRLHSAGGVVVLEKKQPLKEAA